MEEELEPVIYNQDTYKTQIECYSNLKSLLHAEMKKSSFQLQLKGNDRQAEKQRKSYKCWINIYIYC